MKSKKKDLILSIVFIILSIAFTVMVKLIDVKNIGPNNSEIGFASLNKFIFDLFGVNMIFYHITDWLGFIPIAMALTYAIIGVVQIIKRKSFKKFDKEIIVLGIFYIVLVIIYIFFEKVIINYRPVLIDGYLEASYPSSHTLMALCICGSSIIINKKLFSNKLSKIANIGAIVIISVIVIGRLISGVHWFTDIIGGLIISSALLLTFNTIIQALKQQEN